MNTHRMNTRFLSSIACLALAAAALYSAKLCAVDGEMNCMNPPLGGPQTGVGPCPRCANQNTNTLLTVNQIPKKTWAFWRQEDGKDDYATQSLRCSVVVPKTTVCSSCTRTVTIPFTVWGDPELWAWADPNADDCSVN